MRDIAESIIGILIVGMFIVTMLSIQEVAEMRTRLSYLQEKVLQIDTRTRLIAEQEERVGIKYGVNK